MIKKDLCDFLNKKVMQYEQAGFIKDDPISIPHRFSKLQDIEISGFFAAILAWGNRKSIIKSCTRLIEGMDYAPYDFIVNFGECELKPFSKFVHRTFNAIDLFHFFDFLKYHYQCLGEPSLETAFSKYISSKNENIEAGLNGFYFSFFNAEIFKDYPARTKKHIASPAKKSACKRLNMFLRWMVRQNNHDVDFGLWKSINANQLVCPLDIHTARVARHLKLLNRKNNDWLAAVELTNNLKLMNKNDPVSYDFALFGLGIEERF